jgi:hypothetical protein
MTKPARSARTARARKPPKERSSKQRLPKITPEMQRKIDAIEEASKHEFPIGDIDEVLWEIEQGYLGNDR